MYKAPLVFIDSGIGGLPYLEWIKKRMPAESFIYIADNKNFPLGTKTKKQVEIIMLETMSFVVEKYAPKAAVIACNTASVISLKALRNNFDFPIIGVVPAVKPAALLSNKKRIGIMASNRTIEDSYTEDLINQHASDCEVFRYGATEVIDFIENKLSTADEDSKIEILKKPVDYFLENDVDILVLGCTHFLFLEKEIHSLLGNDITIIDSRDGVGNQIIRVLKEEELLSDKKIKDIFILTGNGSEQSKIMNYKWVLERYGLCAV